MTTAWDAARKEANAAKIQVVLTGLIIETGDESLFVAMMGFVLLKKGAVHVGTSGKKYKTTGAVNNRGIARCGRFGSGDRA